MRFATRVAGIVLILVGIMEVADSFDIESKARFYVLATGIVAILVGALVDLFTRHSRQVKMLRRVSMLCLISGAMQAIARPFYPFLMGGTALAGVTAIYLLTIALMVCLHYNFPEKELNRAMEKRKARKNLEDKYRK